MGLKLYVNYRIVALREDGTDMGKIMNYAERPDDMPLEADPGCAILVVEPVQVVFKGTVKLNDRYPDLEWLKVVDGQLVPK